MIRYTLTLCTLILALSNVSYSQPCECIEACLKLLIVDNRPKNQAEYEAMNFGTAKICYEKGDLTKEQYGAQLQECPKFDLWMDERNKLYRFLVGNTKTSLGSMGHVQLDNGSGQLDSVSYDIGDSLYLQYDRVELTALFQRGYDNIKMTCSNPAAFVMGYTTLSLNEEVLELNFRFTTDIANDLGLDYDLGSDYDFGYIAKFSVNSVNLKLMKATYPQEEY